MCIYIYIYICKVIVFLVEKFECECKKVEKWVWYFLPSITRIPPQFVHISYFLWLPPKVNLPYLSFAASEVQQRIFLFLCSFFFPSYMATSLPSYLTENSCFFKEEIKKLALRFHLQSVWVSKLNLIWFCVFG